MPLETMVAVGAIWFDFGRCIAGGTISPGLWGTMATCVMCVCRTVSFGSLNLDIRLSRVRPARNRSKLHARLDWILQGHDTGAEGCHDTRSLQYLACDNPPLPIRNHSIRPTRVRVVGPCNFTVRAQKKYEKRNSTTQIQ